MWTIILTIAAIAILAAVIFALVEYCEQFIASDEP